MAFSIQITQDYFDFEVCEEIAVKGSIEIGSFREELLISLEIWSSADYLRQWKAGLRRISSNDRSYLITSMRDLAASDFIDCWLLYRENNEVIFQNKILLSSELKDKVLNENFVPDRETETEEGHKISEWKTSLADIKKFLERH